MHCCRSVSGHVWGTDHRSAGSQWSRENNSHQHADRINAPYIRHSHHPRTGKCSKHPTPPPNSCPHPKSWAYWFCGSGISWIFSTFCNSHFVSWCLATRPNAKTVSMHGRDVQGSNMQVWRDDMGLEWEGWQRMEKMGGGGGGVLPFRVTNIAVADEMRQNGTDVVAATVSCHFLTQTFNCM